MRLAYGDDQNVAAWVAARIDWMPSDAAAFGPMVAIGVLSGRGEAIGGVVFNNYQALYESIDMSGAADTHAWLTRRLIREILAYPFVQLSCQRITAVTPKKAASARLLLERLGFKREGVARRGFGRHGHAVIYGLLEPEWRRGRFGPALSENLTPSRARVASSPEDASLTPP